MKKLVVTPFGNRILYATVNEKTHTLGAERKDVTDDAISSVLQHYMNMEYFEEKGFFGHTFNTFKNEEVTLCAIKEGMHVVLTQRLYEELTEKASNYDNLCK